MHRPSEADLLGLWEEGLVRHPIDRALLLCAWARPDLPADRFAGLPLGVVNAELLRLRAALFGRQVELQLDCGQCGEALEIPLDLARLAEGGPASDSGNWDGVVSDSVASGSVVSDRGGPDSFGPDSVGPDSSTEIEVDGFRFRLPTSRDLAMIADELDLQAAARRLLEGCCVARPAGDPVTAQWPARADAALEAADPLADPRLALSCPACGRHLDAVLDPGALLWDDVAAFARDLLGQVHALARAYGWTEPEVLALSPRRRAAYLELIGV